MKIIYICLVLLSIVPHTFAQKFTIKGTIKDKDTQKPIEFAYISFPNKYENTTSEKDGSFTMKVPKSYKKEKLLIKRTKYKPVELNPEDWQNKKELQIILSKETEEEEQKRLEAKLQKMINNIPKEDIKLEEKGYFRIIFPRVPITKNIEKNTSDEKLKGKYCIVAPSNISDSITPTCIFRYLEVSKDVIQKSKNDFWNIILKECESEKELFDLRLKSQKNFRYQKYEGIEAIFEANPNGEDYKNTGNMCVKTYFFQSKNRVYRFMFIKEEDLCATFEEVELYLKSFEILE